MVCCSTSGLKTFASGTGIPTHPQPTHRPNHLLSTQPPIHSLTHLPTMYGSTAVQSRGSNDGPGLRELSVLPLSQNPGGVTMFHARKKRKKSNTSTRTCTKKGNEKSSTCEARTTGLGVHKKGSYSRILCVLACTHLVWVLV